MLTEGVPNAYHRPKQGPHIPLDQWPGESKWPHSCQTVGPHTCHPRWGRVRGSNPTSGWMGMFCSGEEPKI